MATAASSTAIQRTGADFTTGFVLEAIFRDGLLTAEQGQEVLAKEPAARARVLKSIGAEASRYDVSPIEIVAAFQIPLPNGRGGTLDQDQISSAVARAAKIDYRKIDPLTLDMALATRTVSKPYAQKHVLLPLERSSPGKLVVAVANPLDRELFENLRRLTGMAVEPVLCAKSDILKAIEDIYGFKKTLARAADDFGGGPEIQNFEQLLSLSGKQEFEASDKPIVQAVDYLLRYAFDNRASDIHIEPKREQSLVRLRIDGVLHSVYTLPVAVHPPLVSRVKMISRMDISEKRRPQDGRIKTERDGREVELRVSTLPTAFGEKVVIRIFDPETLVQDIIMVGEIRDPETAENAIQCALTGHLVLSTLHTNDAVGAITRMKDLGVAPFLLASSLLGVMAQRLLRRLCPHCATETPLTPDELASLQVPIPLLPGGVRLMRGAGCTRCRQTGYFGRSGVFEILNITSEIRDLINRGFQLAELRELARQSGMRSLREAGVLRLAHGLTSFEEVMRMTSSH